MEYLIATVLAVFSAGVTVFLVSRNRQKNLSNEISGKIVKIQDIIAQTKSVQHQNEVAEAKIDGKIEKVDEELSRKSSPSDGEIIDFFNELNKRNKK